MDEIKHIYPQNGFTATVLAAWHRGETIQVKHPLNSESWDDLPKIGLNGAFNVMPAPYRYRIKPQSFEVTLTFEQARKIKHALEQQIIECMTEETENEYRAVFDLIVRAENDA